MTQALTGKTIAVTGGFGALGRAVGDALQAAGAQVALIDKAGAPANLNGDVLALPDIDLGQADATRRVMEQVVARFGALDGLANIAGGFRYETAANSVLDNTPSLQRLIDDLGIAGERIYASPVASRSQPSGSSFCLRSRARSFVVASSEGRGSTFTSFR